MSATEDRRRRELRQALITGAKAALGLGPSPLPRSVDQRLADALDALERDRIEDQKREQS